MTQPRLLSNIIQSGYVTTDLDRALKYFGEALGMRNFSISRDYGIPRNDPYMKINLAMGTIDGHIIELIEPVSGRDGVYRDGLPRDGFAIRFHHHCYSVKTEPVWNETQLMLEKLNFPIVMRNTFSGYFDSLYADTRAALGVYTEYVYLTPDGEKLFNLPAN